MAAAEHNYSHEIENWRQRLVKESKAAKEFEHLYDYLLWKKTPTNLKRPTAAAKFKYYKPSGGDWTVQNRNIPLRVAQNISAPSEDEAKAMQKDPSTYKDASKTAQMTHTLVKLANSRSSVLHRPISKTIGQRHSLEMFGVSGHGRLAVRTKEPVGTGTKVYQT